MAHVGQVLENPLTGARTIFHQTAQETGGALLQLEEVRAAGFTGPPAHVHPRQEECFLVLAGTARIQVSGEDHLLQPGERVAIAPGTAHTWANGGTGEVRALCEFRPALNMEAYFESLYAIPPQQNAGNLVRPSFLQMVLLALTYESFLAGPPIILQKALLLTLKPVALLLGYRAHYPSASARQEHGEEAHDLRLRAGGL